MDAAALQTDATAILAKGRNGDFVGLAGEGVTWCVESPEAHSDRRSGVTFRPRGANRSCFAFGTGRPGGADRPCFAFRPGGPGLTPGARGTCFAAVTFDALWPGWPLCAGFTLRTRTPGRSAPSLSANR